MTKYRQFGATKKRKKGRNDQRMQMGEWSRIKEKGSEKQGKEGRPQADRRNPVEKADPDGNGRFRRILTLFNQFHLHSITF